MSRVAILHLSDIHLKTAGDAILSRAKAIASCLNPLLPSVAHVFIVGSGDISNSGKSAEYSLVKTFFNNIRDGIMDENSKVPISFVMVPGNHDCNLDLNSGSRRNNISSIISNLNPEIDESIIDSCTSVQKEFFKFKCELELVGDHGVVEDIDDPLWQTCSFNIDGKEIVFDCLNVSWVCLTHEKPGTIFFPVKRYENKMTSRDRKPATRCLIMHHPLNWFNFNIYRDFKHFIRKYADIIITGHEHQGGAGVIDDADTGQSAYVEGCELFNTKSPTVSAFNIVQMDLGKECYISQRYELKGTTYAQSETGSWSDFRPMPTKESKLFRIQKAFQERLDDPGALIKHPGGQNKTNITLSDIYIFPDLKKMSGSVGGRKAQLSINSRTLLSAENIADGVLIEGDEKAGCTSLLYQMYLYYHEKGYIPLYINGASLKSRNFTELEELIESEVKSQYGGDGFTAFQQLPKAKKILLLDDFDGSPLKSAVHRADFVCFTKERFGHLVLTVDEMFEMREMLKGDKTQTIHSMTHYRLKPLGYQLRSKLIQKWFRLGDDGRLDEASFIAKCDQAERLMKAVMAKAIIPKMPLYLLVLLQNMDSGNGSADFKDSGLGDYYRYLLTDAFLNIGIKMEKLTEMFQYSTQLAWEFHSKEKFALTEIELRRFNNNFSEKWHTVDFARRLNELMQARVLQERGTEYSFRYPYIYYYLKGIYLHENLSNTDIRIYIEKCCKHLYVRDYANTVLFLAHHNNDDFLLQSIADALHNIVKEYTPITFNNDTNAIEKLIESAPKLEYTGEQPAEHRERLNKRHDEIDEDDNKDGLADKEESSDELSLIAQITALFKTMDILGQVLKNQYSKIQRPRKRSLLQELFNGPLRVLHNFYDLFEKYPDFLVAEIDAAISRKRKSDTDFERRRIASNIVAGLVQFLSFAIIVRAGQGASSDNLFEDIEAVVNENKSLAYKLIQLYIYLDSPKPLPKQQLIQVKREAQTNSIAGRIMEQAIFNRLYMFHTTEADMQWLSTVFKIDIGKQHSLNYLESKSKLV